MSLIIVGGSGGTNIGDAFFKAATELNLEPVFLNTQLANEAPGWLRRVNWHLRGKLPSRLSAFSQDVVQACLDFKPKWLLTTGLAPVNQQALQKIGSLSVQRVNFLTDDPWNSAHYAPWFFKALPDYDVIFSPRRANINDLLRTGCQNVQYLPFGFDPELFFEIPTTQKEENQFDYDVVFAGGADRDRVDYISALINSGIRVSLYGQYWQRYPQTRTHTHGQANVNTLRLAISNAKVALCLVRKANRDGNCMRTFEVPAIGTTCMLTEDTQEHREIFGEEGEAVVYFKTIPEMVQKAHWLLSHKEERQRLAKNAHLLIAKGANTYRDRLKTILDTSNLMDKN